MEFTSPTTTTRSKGLTSGRRLNKRLLDGDKEFRRLLRMRARSNAQEEIWLLDPQLFEKHGGEIRIVVLARVNQHRFMLWVFFEGPKNGRHLHEVGACPNETGKTTHETF